ncbi:MarR family transcriptional regulator [Capsulimonas corticalis]|uniref:MarR family transcriptional regulator n=1 Tax=Capsulimonas corticalis TaxID=2219043 RepID=A0A402D1L2_9BACT|nr:MarR family transcriptional regulator [Capsulimonas corticalis]BDI28675.1 MarR family transcriptional regulator [Capsulimonas corticalis]
MRIDKVDEILAQWRREQPELNTETIAVVGRILLSAEMLKARIQPVFESYGVSFGGGDVLASLRRNGPPYELSPTQLYRELMLTSGTMTNRLDRLERDGFIIRRPNPDDRRSALVCMTPKGLATINTIMHEHMENEQDLLHALSAEDQQQLAGLLSRLILSL